MKDQDVAFDDENIENMEEDKNIDEKNIVNLPLSNKESEQLQNNPAYRAWLIRARSNVGVLMMLEKLCLFGD